MTASGKRLPDWLLLTVIGLSVAAVLVYVVLDILGK